MSESHLEGNMTVQEADEWIVTYWRKTAEENDERAGNMGLLADRLTDKRRAEFTRLEARLLREQAGRMREAAKNWP
jgi:hypothetical protein